MYDVKALVEKFKNDQNFARKLSGKKSTEEIQVLINSEGFELTLKEVEKFLIDITKISSHISDKNLENVVGGMEISCDRLAVVALASMIAGALTVEVKEIINNKIKYGNSSKKKVTL